MITIYIIGLNISILSKLSLNIEKINQINEIKQNLKIQN